MGDEETAALINQNLETAASPFHVGPVREVNEHAQSESEEITKRERCKKAFFKAVTVTKAVMTQAQLGKRLELRQRQARSCRTWWTS